MRSQDSTFPQLDVKVEWLEQDGQKLEVLVRPGWRLVLDGDATKAREKAKQRRKAKNWNHGVRLDAAGYVLVYVGKQHHLAYEAGSAFEHRLMAEQKIGRRLHGHHKQRTAETQIISAIRDGLPFSPIELFRSGKCDLSYEVLRFTCKRLARIGKIVRVKFGVYRLP